MTKLKLIVGTYNSEPPGSTDYQLELKYQNSYKPFLKVLYEYPKIRASLHYSGALLEWFEQKHPEILILINEMIKRRQVEMIGGGFYSPVLALIPAKDRINQIELLTTYIRKKFGRRPRGFWLTEYIWEPFICSSIHSSGMNFTFLEDAQFERAGVDKKEIYEPCYTEDQGKTLAVIPVHTKLIAKAVKQNPEDFIDNLSKIKIAGPNTIVSLMIDGSLMNCSDSEQLSCKWIDKFFSLLSEKYSSGFKFTRAGDYVKTLSLLKKIYFPVSSGRNIDFLALSSEKQREWLNSRNRHNKKTEKNCPQGYFRQYLTKYEESSLLYSKMLFTHNLVSQIKSDKSRKKSAGEEILKSQSHYPFWHGKYTGFYDPSLRQYAYRSLINSEKNIREKGKFSTNLQTFDFDMDGSDEFLYRGQYINVYVHKRGGRLFELDYLVTPWNYLNTVRRYPESYHTLENIKYKTDKYSRDSFMDHFFSSQTEKIDFETGNYIEKGDFLSGIYNLQEMDREHKEFVLTREGVVNSLPVLLEKKYNFKKNFIEVTYRIKNQGMNSLKGAFGVELNFSFFSPEKKHLQIRYDNTENEGSADLAIHDLKNKVLISLNSGSEFDLWDYPVYSNTKIKDIGEDIYQYNTFVLRWNIDIKPGEMWENIVTLKLEKKQ